MQAELIEQEQDALYNDIDFPFMTVLCEMEKQGIAIDCSVLEDIKHKLEQELMVLREHIAHEVGEAFANININSPQQIAHLLFDVIGLQPVKKTARKTGYSTNQDVLKELASQHPVPALIVRYRELFKLKSTYLDALPHYVNEKTGRIHTNFSQVGVATGRLSSSDPNLQNIPADSNTQFPIRKAFIPSKGCSFIAADYSQVELRVLAYLSQDENLKRAFAEGEDIHTRTATGLFGIESDAVTHEQRQIAKRINFSILYGLTPYGLSQDLKIPFQEAKTYIDTFMAHYPRVPEWMDAVVEETKRHGYVTTLWGRRRYVPGIYEQNKTLYEMARRVAINTKVQGTTADLMKVGMLQLAGLFQAKGMDTNMLLQIHDEILFEAPNSESEVAQKYIVDCLQNVVSWDVPLAVSAKTGKTWYDVSK
jgi:DNA polymerase-1